MEKKDMSGRIGRIPEYTIGYYRRVQESLKEGFENHEMKEAFISNVFDQLKSEIIQLSQNQTVSRIIEEILPLLSSFHLCAILQELTAAMQTVIFDRIASHVLQKTLILALEHIQESSDLVNAIVSVSQQAQTYLDEALQDTYASHVVRTLIEVLGGIKITHHCNQRESLVKGQVEVIVEDRQEVFIRQIHEWTEEVTGYENIQEVMKSATASPVLGTIIHVLHHTNQGSKRDELCLIIIHEGKLLKMKGKKNKEKYRVLLEHPVASHLLEIILDVCNVDVLHQLVDGCFCGNLVDLSLHPVSNHIIQILIKRTSRIPSLFPGIFSELMENLEAIINSSHLGVIYQLTEACLEYEELQETLIKSILSAYHCWEPPDRQVECVILLATNSSFEERFPCTDDQQGISQSPRQLEVKFHGSLVLQTLLKFKNKKVLGDSFVNLSPEDAKSIICQSTGSFLVEGFVKNDVVEKVKKKFVNKLQGQLFEVACNKNGSRCLEALFKLSSLGTKELIAEELSQKETQLMADKFGRFVHKTCAVGTYKHRRKAWTEMQTSQSKKRKLFSELLDNSREMKEKYSKKKKKKDSAST